LPCAARANPPERIQDFFAAVSDFFITRGATLVFTAESMFDALLTELQRALPTGGAR
jgi:hypothetical protein